MTTSRTQTEPSERPSSAEAYYLDPSVVSESGWMRLAEMLVPAVSRQTDYTLQQLLEKIASSHAQLWAIVEPGGYAPIGAMVTQVVTYPSGTVGCEITACSTDDTDIDWDSMRSVVATIERFAVDQGADFVRILGRRGWQRVFKDYDLDYVCITKRVKELSS